MTTISIHAETNEASLPHFRAVAGTRQSVGRTPGEALDALNAQLGAGESSSLVVVQQMFADVFFSEAQYLRMRELLDKRPALSEAEQEELQNLAKAELLASAKRTEALADALGR